MIDADRREQLLRIYAESRTIAVVGASADEMKAAHQIPRYLQAQGERIVPVNPRAAALQASFEELEAAVGKLFRELREKS